MSDTVLLDPPDSSSDLPAVLSATPSPKPPTLASMIVGQLRDITYWLRDVDATLDDREVAASRALAVAKTLALVAIGIAAANTLLLVAVLAAVCVLVGMAR